MSLKGKGVTFDGEGPETRTKKQPPTQKYDRKEIQKRLDIETWMDEEMQRLYQVEVSDIVFGRYLIQQDQGGLLVVGYLWWAC